jgi:hypothetical protein
MSHSELASLLENFDETFGCVDTEIGAEWGMDSSAAEQLEVDGLIEKAHTHKALQYYKATSLGLRVIEAAVRAANEELTR